jgi:hypothetical protein
LSKPETGVSFFATFLLALVVGFMLVVAGMPTLGAVLFAVAMISILAMVLTPSPKAMAERQAAAPSEGEGMEEGDEGSEGVEEEDRPTIVAPPAPTSARPSVPAPPPEPPPLEELVVDVEPEGTGEVGEVEDSDETVEEDILVEL